MGLRTAIVLQQGKLFGTAGPAVQVTTLQDAESLNALDKTGKCAIIYKVQGFRPFPVCRTA